jgi:rare lipoprotein A
LARKLKGETELAEVGSPIIVDSLPKTKVSSQLLPGIGSNKQLSPTPVPVSQASQPVVPPLNNDELSIHSTDEKVTVEEVLQQVRIFIQAGAFSNFENANRVRANLSGLGEVKISSVLINGQDLFRVRVGPLGSIAKADHMLRRVFDSGYMEARTIVD